MPKHSRTLIQAERRELRRIERTMHLLIRIRTDLDPEEFTRDELQDEFGVGGGEKSHVLPPQRMEPMQDLPILLEEGYIEKKSDGTYRVTAKGYAVDEEAYYGAHRT